MEETNFSFTKRFSLFSKKEITFGCMFLRKIENYV